MWFLTTLEREAPDAWNAIANADNIPEEAHRWNMNADWIVRAVEQSRRDAARFGWARISPQLHDDDQPGGWVGDTVASEHDEIEHARRRGTRRPRYVKHADHFSWLVLALTRPTIPFRQIARGGADRTTVTKACKDLARYLSLTLPRRLSGFSSGVARAARRRKARA
jgi:hypothetical protein